MKFFIRYLCPIVYKQEFLFGELGVLYFNVTLVFIDRKLTNEKFLSFYSPTARACLYTFNF